MKFNSVREAAKYIGKSEPTISNNLSRNSKTIARKWIAYYMEES